MKVDQGLVNWFRYQAGTMRRQKARDLKKFLDKTELDPQQFFEVALEGKDSLQEVVDDLLIDNPPDRSAPS